MKDIYTLLTQIKDRTGCFCIDLSLNDIQEEDITLLTLTLYHEDVIDPISYNFTVDTLEDFDIGTLITDFSIAIDSTSLYYHPHTSQRLH